jgi:phosphonoacetaldehyde hydrolase
MKPATHLKAVMLDWAGTTVDHGSIAPVRALQALFANRGIGLSNEDARRDMGLLKRDHIAAILELPDMRAEWRIACGREPTADDVGTLFEEFIPLQKTILCEHSAVIEGVAEAVDLWRLRGLRIGSTTGYTREMLAPVLEQAIAAGYRPDATVCPDEVGAGRPAPWMLLRNMQLLDAYPPRACVKIGDTVSDVEEGLNAGMWTIGITRTGNLVGLDAEGWCRLPAAEKMLAVQQAERVLLAAGAHFVAENLPACGPILDEIERRLENGGSPG